MSTLAELEAVFLGALEHESPGERASFLERACRDQPGLRSDVDRILAAHWRVGDFLEGPTTAVASLADTLVGPARRQSLDFLSPPDREGAIGRLGPYVILEVIGSGGFGVVFKALDEKLQRLVAIKALAAPLATSAVARERFVREARAVAAINHENVVRLYAVEDAEPIPYLVMEYVAGTSLQARLQKGPLAASEIQRIGLQIAEGLTAAHARGLVHRDIKPANILLEEATGRAKITDFGQARALDDASHSQEGLIAGTPEYMSPEQARGLAADHRSDLFSLGSVLYAMCVGRPAFDALGGALSTLRQICEQEPLPIAACDRSIPPWLVSVITRLHAKNPAARFQSAAEVMAALCQGSEAVTAVPAAKSKQWKTALSLTAAAIAVLVVAWQIIIRIQGPDGQETTIRPATGSKVILENHGQQVASVTDDSPPPFRALAGHRGAVWNVAFAGNRILTAGEDQWVRIWDLESGSEVQRFDGHKNTVYGLAVSPDGKRALSSSGCRLLSKVEDVTWSVCLWEIETGKELQRVEGRGPGITSVSFSPDGERALLAGYEGVVRQWDIKAWRETGTFRAPGGIWSVCFSPDGQRALTAGGEGGEARICLWELPSGTELKRYEGHKFGTWQAAFLPDGQSLLSGGQDETMRCWATDTGRQLGMFRHGGQVTRMAVSGDGRYAVAGAWVNKDQHSLKLFQLDPPQELHVFRGPWAALNAVALSPDGRWCLAGSSDGSVRLWRMPKLPEAASPTLPVGEGRGEGVTPVPGPKPSP